jgi:hypothetical protein
MYGRTTDWYGVGGCRLINSSAYQKHEAVFTINPKIEVRREAAILVDESD